MFHLLNFVHKVELAHILDDLVLLLVELELLLLLLLFLELLLLLQLFSSSLSINLLDKKSASVAIRSAIPSSPTF